MGRPWPRTASHRDQPARPPRLARRDDARSRVAGRGTSRSTPPGSSPGSSVHDLGHRVSVSLSLAIFYFGLIAALASFVAFRWFARAERRRAALVLGEPIPERRRERDGLSSIFGKVRLPPSNTDHRCVLAVLTFLRT